MLSLLIAGILAGLLGFVHSALGEILIFSGWRKTPPDIPRRHYNIIWASWHLVTLMGLGIGGALLWLSQHSVTVHNSRPLIISLAAALGAGGMLVLFATRGKHPGWIVLGLISALIAMSIT